MYCVTYWSHESFWQLSPIEIRNPTQGHTPVVHKNINGDMNIPMAWAFMCQVCSQICPLPMSDFTEKLWEIHQSSFPPFPP